MKSWMIFIVSATMGAAVAQPVYRCGNTYSHDPCPNAKEVDITYTEGLDTMSGKK